MMRAMRFLFLLPVLLGVAILAQAAEESYPVHEDSKVHEGVPKGEMIKAIYTADEKSVFPGTEREYQLYIPAGLDTTKPMPFMVFQDGVIYNAPVVFDNLIAKKEIPAMIGIFIKPGVVPAANPEALPRFNRSYEYDSVTDTYSRFLIDEFLPAITQKHGLILSTDPNDAGISGNSSGGICAFMVAWHRSDRFRRVFTGVGTYVGIHGADQLLVLVRKMEPKPIKVYLQSGENDNNLYCGDWWMANQMMERSLTWAGYDVAHTWGTGGHNGKQATAIFPDVMRWLWKGYPEAKIKANPEGKSKWLGYEVLKEGSEWEVVLAMDTPDPFDPKFSAITSDKDGNLFAGGGHKGEIQRIGLDGKSLFFASELKNASALAVDSAGNLLACAEQFEGENYLATIGVDGKTISRISTPTRGVAVSQRGAAYVAHENEIATLGENGKLKQIFDCSSMQCIPSRVALSPDQTQLYLSSFFVPYIFSFSIQADGSLAHEQSFFETDALNHNDKFIHGLCVDSEGRLYAATGMGVQVCDQAGRVNFIIPTPQEPRDICFGGKDLSELFIACGDKIYKRSTKVHGVVSGQQPPIKPAPPKL